MAFIGEIALYLKTGFNVDITLSCHAHPGLAGLVIFLTFHAITTFNKSTNQPWLGHDGPAFQGHCGAHQVHTLEQNLPIQKVATDVGVLPFYL